MLLSWSMLNMVEALLSAIKIYLISVLLLLFLAFSIFIWDPCFWCDPSILFKNLSPTRSLLFRSFLKQSLPRYGCATASMTSNNIIHSHLSYVIGRYFYCYFKRLLLNFFIIWMTLAFTLNLSFRIISFLLLEFLSSISYSYLQ